MRENVSKSRREKILPSECREAGLSYRGKFCADVCFQWDNKGAVIRERFNFGHIPIMLKSKLCHLRGASPHKLISLKEEATEMGGYFICSGMERLFRLLIMPKRNYPMAFVRDAFRNRGEGYSNQAVVIRCVREDQSAVTLKLYYLLNGSARLGFTIRGREILLPVGIVLKVRSFEIHS
ncbi:DNA-directed RNA polymerase I subunit 2 [Cinnamomum micranthum f. kanehirae]|uniref:DNA-directed RNA polymerase n=1 Tax=Cinnamomum micranthum f. kanehirae TaxID=337451 RepID=A0A443PRK8_9MAGN|nr:DNA-directed RNA polymerase I subunit 2 [Cinnamomum micranthum f. kanehirae]